LPWIYGPCPWVPSASLSVIPRHKKGAIVLLNKFGKIMLAPSYPTLITIGVIITDGYDIFYPDKHSESPTRYWGYDVLFGDQLVKMVPEDFIGKVEEDNEENTE